MTTHWTYSRARDTFKLWDSSKNVLTLKGHEVELMKLIRDRRI